MNNPKLPAGIAQNSGIEIFRTEKYKANCTYNGRKLEYLDLPTEIRQLFQSELIQDKHALAYLQDENLADGNEIEEAFVSCRYGNFDDTPDMVDGKTSPDSPNCGNELNCAGFGILCRIPAGRFGNLTKTEYIIIRLVAQGKLDKEISNELENTVDTVKKHLSNIRTKLGVNNRVEIALWAHKRKIY
ncbi:MAG: LuxR C-terminal-related transcriptional regulator [Bacteroidales bacterium]|jgi:DNA-binding CsgD family transcriptional regulator|nr:LuxR C-terminal-related transcriptional regulator [Bacteroidales bacterium]